jgi:hypothetical protein
MTMQNVMQGLVNLQAQVAATNAQCHVDLLYLAKQLTLEFEDGIPHKVHEALLGLADTLGCAEAVSCMGMSDVDRRIEDVTADAAPVHIAEVDAPVAMETLIEDEVDLSELQLEPEPLPEPAAPPPAQGLEFVDDDPTTPVETEGAPGLVRQPRTVNVSEVAEGGPERLQRPPDHTGITTQGL